MKWTFNLEKAPWWGGVFERLVRSVKRCLKKTISGARLTYEELLTVVIEVEMILNCRPLSFVSSEDFEEPLTPSHLLCGRRMMSLPDNSSDTEQSDTDVQPKDLRNKKNGVMAYQNSMKKLSFLGSRFPLRRIFRPAGLIRQNSTNSYTTFCKDDTPGPAVSSGRTDPVPTAGGVRA